MAAGTDPPDRVHPGRSWRNAARKLVQVGSARRRLVDGWFDIRTNQPTGLSSSCMFGPVLIVGRPSKAVPPHVMQEINPPLRTAASWLFGCTPKKHCPGNGLSTCRDYNAFTHVHEEIRIAPRQRTPRRESNQPGAATFSSRFTAFSV